MNNTLITFTNWSEQIGVSMPTISMWKKRLGKDSVFPFPQVIEKRGTEKFYSREELDSWYAVFRANYPLFRNIFVPSADREIVEATRRIARLKDVFERTQRELQVLEAFVESKTKENPNKQGEEQ